MFRCVRRLGSKPTAARHRALQAAMRTVSYSALAPNGQSAHADEGKALLASICPAYKTTALAQLLQKSLPSTANVLTIDGTAGDASSSAASVLRFVITCDEEVSKLQRNPEHSHPLLVLVQTSLDKDDAEANEFVLSTALQQRDRFKSATAVVLDVKQSAVAKSILKSLRGKRLEAKKEEEAAEVPAGATPSAVANAAVGDQREAAAVDGSERGTERQSPEVKAAAKTSPPKKSSATTPTTATTTTSEPKLSASGKKGAKSTKVGDKTNADGSRSLSYTPPPGVAKGRFTSVPSTRKDTRESLQQMFRSSLAAPFQPPKQVERALFSGYVDKVRIADMMNLPVYGSGEVYALYYRLTGAGACRTPLITITQIFEEECRRKGGKKTKNMEALTTPRVPVLLLLGASFLIAEDAALMRQEYQKTLEQSLSPLADVAVVVVPTCFTEKNVLFALRSASIEAAGEASQEQQGYKEVHEEGGKVVPPSTLRRRGQDAGQLASESLSENVLRSVVANALEEVALRHEKSTDHLVSTLNKLVEYWSRERVIELMEGLQSEREALIDATKEFEHVQRQLRHTQEVMEALRTEVKSIGDKIEQRPTADAGAASGDMYDLVDCTRRLEERLAEYVSALPSKEQFSLDVREDLEDVQKTLLRQLDQTLSKKLKIMHEDQQRGLQQLLEGSSSGNEGGQQLTQRVLQELPERIESAMEKALKSFSQDSDERTRSVLERQQEVAHSQLSAFCDRLCQTVEAGQGRVERVVSELMSTKSDGNDTARAEQSKPPELDDAMTR
ncbi:uncharacterized protein Tco025E_01512 [Trypanosoma conorhini]|uniref:Uncharacterized protein n=1 Tax=Trypanosoma conorhini TaxID=83891 RepID=A0A3R7LFG1_9TRYP|nr:uncharacterized protein Tco025E_01512 [Trypanosoma conorhini]RNF26238.1 hypothetical protein Tco025E_01512 [Trypanosoma conorhini]